MGHGRVVADWPRDTGAVGCWSERVSECHRVRVAQRRALPGIRSEGPGATGAALRSIDATATPSAARPPESIPAQIRELADLHAAGVLTDEEFSAMKAEMLARM